MPTAVMQTRHAANDHIRGYLAFQSRLLGPDAAWRLSARRTELAELLTSLASNLPECITLNLHEHPVLTAPNGVIFASAGPAGLLQFRLRRPFPEVELSVGLLPAEDIGPDWCYCDPRGEPEANLELWAKSAYDFALNGVAAGRF